MLPFPPIICIFALYLANFLLSECLRLNAHKYSLPNISFNSYLEADSVKQNFLELDINAINFTTDFISKNGSEYTLYEGITQVSFVCEAEYPVTWVFLQPNQIPAFAYYSMESVETRVSHFQLDTKLQTPTNLRYLNKIQITFTDSVHGISFISINLTCASTEKAETQSSIYVHLQGKEVLENQGKVAVVEYPLASSPLLILPCRASYSYSNVILERRVAAENVHYLSQKDQWAQYNSTQVTIVYNSKTGFTLTPKIKRTIPELVGVYRCSIEQSREKIKTPQDYVYIYVCPPLNSSVIKILWDDEPIISSLLPSESQLSEKSSVVLETDGVVPKIKCCTGKPNKLPLLYVHWCSSSVMCKLLVPHLSAMYLNNTEESVSSLPIQNSTDCAKHVIYEAVEMVTCSSDSVHFAETFVAVFYPWVNGPVVNRTTELAQEGNRRWQNLPNRTFSSLTYHTALTNFTFAQKVAIFVARYSRQSLAEHKDTGIQFARKLLKNEIVELLKLKPDYLVKSIDLTEYNRDIYYTGEPLFFLCVGVAHFYSEGAQMAVTWKNSTKTVLKQPTLESAFEKYIKVLHLAGNATMFNRNGFTTETIFAEPIAADVNIRSVECWMPVKESSGWDTLSRNVTVLPSVAPRFVEEVNEIRYVYWGDVNIKVTCTVVDSKPSPRVHVTWKGKPVRLYVVSKLENLTNLHFSHEDSSYMPIIGLATINRTEGLIKVILEFEKIELEYHGEVKCISKNVNATVTRTVKILVIEKSFLRLPVLLGVCGLPLLVMLALLSKRLWQRRQCFP